MLNTQLLIDNLVDKGWSYQHDTLSLDLTLRLAQLCKSRVLSKASIGKGKSVNQEIRGDNISWVEKDETESEIQAYTDTLSHIQSTLNENLFLGLKDVEYHFAQYPERSFYKRHKDCFNSDDNRTVTFITYLNPDWKEGDGGELRLYTPEGFVDIKPIGGSSICFISSEVEHEVLMSYSERLSLTGWFLKNIKMF